MKLEKILGILSICLSILLKASGGAWAVSCPVALKEWEVEGPKHKTILSGQTTVSCEYFLENKSLGIIHGSYYNVANRKKAKACGPKLFPDAKLKSSSFRAAVSYEDKNEKDNFKLVYWRELSGRLLKEIEGMAMSCEDKY